MSLNSLAASGVETLLENIRFELMLFDSFDDELQHLSVEATVATTTSPQLGVDRAIAKSEVGRTSGRGFE